MNEKIFWLRNSHGKVIACVVAELVSPKCVRYAVAIHNPKDEFNESLGVQVAERRLHYGRNKYRGTVSPLGDVRMNILYAIANDPYQLAKVRSSAQRAIERGDFRCVSCREEKRVLAAKIGELKGEQETVAESTPNFVPVNAGSSKESTFAAESAFAVAAV